MRTLIVKWPRSRLIQKVQLVHCAKREECIDVSLSFLEKVTAIQGMN